MASCACAGTGWITDGLSALEDLRLFVPPIRVARVRRQPGPAQSKRVFDFLEISVRKFPVRREDELQDDVRAAAEPVFG